MRARSIAVVASLVVTAGCASWFMNGGKLVDKGYAPTVKAAYKAPTCKNLVDGSNIAGPDVVYQLVQDEQGTGIFERSPDGTGAVITNHWTDDKGDHYFGWVQNNGWEYVIPPEPAGKTAMRIAYSSLQTKAEGTITKPTSPPMATCEMVPAK
jgi:hypothetical protein